MDGLTNLCYAGGQNPDADHERCFDAGKVHLRYGIPLDDVFAPVLAALALADPAMPERRILRLVASAAVRGRCGRCDDGRRLGRTF